MDDQAAGVADIGEMAEQRHAVDQLDAGFIAALQAKGEHAARALGAIFLGRCSSGRPPGPDNSPRPTFAALALSHLATASALSQCFCMRRGRVSMPVWIRKAFIGDSAGPRSRRPSTRQAMAKAMSPNVSHSRMP